MGTITNQDLCETCGEPFKTCLGHFGAIPTNFAFPIPMI